YSVCKITTLLLLCTQCPKATNRCHYPACGDMSLTQACPLNYSPVCGNDGITYPNECALCVHRLQTNNDILIVKEGRC
uniref:Kazal-like domain-containing protein n=1 Tax=Pygocentrus nattereri TaxID=42514 RepID=A0A3B4C8U0_PYGNA